VRHRRRVRVLPALVVIGLLGPAPPAAPARKSRAATHVGDRSLRPGAHGRDVRHLQRLLGQVGLRVVVDAKYGPGTAAAVKQFQRATHLPPSGVVGPKTARALLRAARGGRADTRSGGLEARRPELRSHRLGDRIPVRPGMSGHDIRVLQDFLTRAGFATPIDGEFGRSTLSAARAFEAAANRRVSGVLDAVDLAALRQLAGGAAPQPGEPNAPLALAPADRAAVGPDGLAIAPAAAPDAVKAVIAAGNAIAKHPYRYGGGHAGWEDTGYDCSGSVSYVLHAAGLLESSMPSGGFMTWGEEGVGQWMTVYANSGHVYMVVAGLRLDTSGAQQDGSRWHTSMRTTNGYAVRHAPGM
jgi:peptidoglycan hydrolase-like protein with peptidoglycan-binding domain